MTGVEEGRWEFDEDDEWFGSDDDTDVDSDEVRKRREREIGMKRDVRSVVLFLLLFFLCLLFFLFI